MLPALTVSDGPVHPALPGDVKDLDPQPRRRARHLGLRPASQQRLCTRERLALVQCHRVGEGGAALAVDSVDIGPVAEQDLGRVNMGGEVRR